MAPGTGGHARSERAAASGMREALLSHLAQAHPCVRSIRLGWADNSWLAVAASRWPSFCRLLSLALAHASADQAPSMSGGRDPVLLVVSAKLALADVAVLPLSAPFAASVTD